MKPRCGASFNAGVCYCPVAARSDGPAKSHGVVPGGTGLRGADHVACAGGGTGDDVVSGVTRYP